MPTGLEVIDQGSIEVDQSIRLVWVKVQYAAAHLLTEVNPKLHDLQKNAASIIELGFNDPPKFDPSLNGGRGGLIYGNGRTEALAWLEVRHRQDPEQYPRPNGIGVEQASGDWVMPLKIGVDAGSESKALQYLVDHNALGMMGGDFSPLDIARVFDSSSYAQLLGSIGEMLELEGDADYLENGMITRTVPADMLSTLMAASGDNGWDFDQSEHELDGRDSLDDPGPEPEDDLELGGLGDSPDDIEQGSLLRVLDVCIDEPRTQVSTNQVWMLDGHFLIICDVLSGWPTWAPYLAQSPNPERPVIFCPYPGPFVALSARADSYTLVLVQPSLYIAGHIIDRFIDVHGAELVDMLELDNAH
jgi:hypothetical protein